MVLSPRELSDTICQQYQELNGPFGCIRITCHADNCVEVQGKVAVVKNIYCANKVSKHLQMVRFIGTWNSMQKNN